MRPDGSLSPGGPRFPWQLYRLGNANFYMAANTSLPIQRMWTGHTYAMLMGLLHNMQFTFADPRGTGVFKLKGGGKLSKLLHIFHNPDLPELDDYYEPFTFDYEHLHNAPKSQAAPVARPRSLVTGERMEKIKGGPNWEEILGGEFSKRSADKNFEEIQKQMYGEFENTFLMYLPRLCEHCLNPACVASCPSGSIYKREEDGIVLIDQDKCRGWRMCVSGCPYKKIYYNWSSGKSEKCIFCEHRVKKGELPWCVLACPAKARIFGDQEDSNSEISKLLKQHKPVQLKNSKGDLLKPGEKGTRPNVYYIRSFIGVS